ncbi:hypothetical protein F5Y06DRAFT_270243 [Hypoxylon sp. FL0890]|nr:hypothetical protein F5Y06DRAFT_270243 [Hypoxylon sp. FL0890]
MPQKDVAASFTNYLRKASKLRCPIASCGDEFPDIEDRIRGHVQSCHPDLLECESIEKVVQDIKRGYIPRLGAATAVNIPPDIPLERPPLEGNDISPYKRRKSPISSTKSRPRSPSPLRRSQARVTASDPAFRRAPQVGKLWSPDEAASSSPCPKQPSRPSRNVGQPKSRPDFVEDEGESTIKQPETRPISQEQLIAEVKGIYAGLVMVESKCIEVDNAQSTQNETQLDDEQWQALIALHRTLLHEHHDFFLASQHPSASPALRRLASKYSMPARMWRHGIHSFLELLRHRLPHSLEHMLTFIYLSYSMMALLYETVPAFEDTWIECLGDLGRYRMAIEDDDIRERELWTSVSRRWYSKASDRAPNTGRLYHHLAILARPDPLQQLYYYTKSLCAPIPFSSTRESITTLFDPITRHDRLTSIDVAFVRAHSILFQSKSPDDFLPTVKHFCSMLDDHIAHTTRKRIESGYYVSFSNSWGLGSVVRTLYPLLLTSMVLSLLPMTSASPVRRTPDIQEVKPNDSLAFRIGLNIGMLGVVVGYIAYSFHHRDRWSFLGLGTGVSTWAYVVMVMADDVSLDLIVSAGILCTVLTFMWTSYDLRESGMRQSRKQLAKYCIVTGAVALDVAISSFLAPTSNPLFGAQKPPSPGLMMAVLAVPCATLSVVLCMTLRTVGTILAEPGVQPAVYPAPNQEE